MTLTEIDAALATARKRLADAERRWDWEDLERWSAEENRLLDARRDVTG